MMLIMCMFYLKITFAVAKNELYEPFIFGSRNCQILMLPHKSKKHSELKKFKMTIHALTCLTCEEIKKIPWDHWKIHNDCW